AARAEARAGAAAALGPGTPPGAAARLPSRPTRTGCRGRPPAAIALPCSRDDLLLPDRADKPELALDRARRPGEPPRDLLDGVAFHLPRATPLRLGIVQAAQQGRVLLARLAAQLGGGPPAEELFQPRPPPPPPGRGRAGPPRRSSPAAPRRATGAPP